MGMGSRVTTRCCGGFSVGGGVLRCWKNKVCPRVPELVRIGWSGLVAVNTGLFHNLYIH